MKTIIENLIALQTLELDSAHNHGRKIKTLRDEIPPQILAYFDRFLTRGKTGIALVRNGVCQGCHIQVTISVVNALAHGVAMSNCVNCGRYLHMQPEEV